MKKILLIITITLCIFQMVVMATDIDIGYTATYYNSTLGAQTLINKSNAANDTGRITSINIYVTNTENSVSVATFYSTGTNIFCTRDYELIGTVEGGAVRTFSVDLDVQIGDYIGTDCYNTCINSGAGTGLWYTATNDIPCTDKTFTFYATNNYAISLYGTGTTEEPPVAGGNAIMMGTNF